MHPRSRWQSNDPTEAVPLPSRSPGTRCRKKAKFSGTAQLPGCPATAQARGPRLARGGEGGAAVAAGGGGAAAQASHSTRAGDAAAASHKRLQPATKTLAQAGRTGGVVGAGVQDDDGALGGGPQVLNHALQRMPPPIVTSLAVWASFLFNAQHACCRQGAAGWRAGGGGRRAAQQMERWGLAS